MSRARVRWKQTWKINLWNWESKNFWKIVDWFCGIVSRWFSTEISVAPDDSDPCGKKRSYISRGTFLPRLARLATRATNLFVHIIVCVFPWPERKREREKLKKNAPHGRKSRADLAYKPIARLYAMYFYEQYWKCCYAVQSSYGECIVPIMYIDIFN